jgi:hypothetical protein
MSTTPECDDQLTGEDNDSTLLNDLEHMLNWLRAQPTGSWETFPENIQQGMTERMDSICEQASKVQE